MIFFLIPGMFYIFKPIVPAYKGTFLTTILEDHICITLLNVHIHYYLLVLFKKQESVPHYISEGYGECRYK
jgi:hypothetical protein